MSEPDEAGRPTSRPRVLLVEDHHPLLTVLCEVLERAGFETAGASTAAQAVDSLAGRRYAAIVADCSLPDLPALDWLTAVRGAAPTTPLVLLSGLVSLQDAQRLVVEFRAATLLKKPCAPDELVAAVRRAIDGR
jgi:DNA-binding response OmpR family regulator